MPSPPKKGFSKEGKLYTKILNGVKYVGSFLPGFNEYNLFLRSSKIERNPVTQLGRGVVLTVAYFLTIHTLYHSCQKTSQENFTIPELPKLEELITIDSLGIKSIQCEEEAIQKEKDLSKKFK